VSAGASIAVRVFFSILMGFLYHRILGWYHEWNYRINN
jgi:hypothetical protein